MGARLDGYHSDITRTYAVGRAASEERAVYATVLAAQLAGLEATRAGVACRDVDAAARAVIDEAGYGERFGHGTGHGVGLEIHEKPRVGRRSTREARGGHGGHGRARHLPRGRFGVRIEDTVVVTPGGCERLTLAGKELRLVD